MILLLSLKRETQSAITGVCLCVYYWCLSVCLLLVSVCALQCLLLWFCLSMCLCMCLCVCVCVCVSLYVSVCLCMCLCVFVCVCVSLYVSRLFPFGCVPTHTLSGSMSHVACRMLMSHVACRMSSQDFHSHGPRAENIQRTDVLGCPRILTRIDAHALSKETYLCRKRPSTFKRDLICVVISAPIYSHALPLLHSPTPTGLESVIRHVRKRTRA